MSRMVSGSCRSSKAGCRKRRAAAGSAKPRCTSTLAAGGADAAARRPAPATAAASGAGQEPARRARTNSWRNTRQANRLRPVSSSAMAAGDLVFEQEFLVPVGLQFVDVEAGIVVEGQFQRAGHAFVDAQLAQPRLVVALLVAVELAARRAAPAGRRYRRPRIRGVANRISLTPVLMAASRNIW